MKEFLDIAITPGVRQVQQEIGTAHIWERMKGKRVFELADERQADFIRARDSFYMATVSETGWPYVQHRGGPPGFLKVLDEKTLAFADFSGNRQYLSLGNARSNDKASLILVDYPHRARMKILARLEFVSAADRPDLAELTALPGYRAKVERIALLHVEAIDWNCPQHITPRFTETEIAEALSGVKARIEALEAENERLKAQLEAG
ncbi:pyridoxamine 5'-phosphate oxidase family protein [Maricaulis sp.]|uniref:pyridoxamine 5'-phosphate oxidase family protein n=1 Tax=Maricaulis sp. TaxID=1486257 RepID=UPI002639C415|nr:pyridoxamine 5'-phosphate oxidase family protein [Maricaulis sp.]